MDTAELLERIRAHVGTQEPSAQVKSIKPMFGGACQDNVRVDLTLPGGVRRMVLRADAPTSLPGSLNRDQEFQVIQAAVAHGVPTPAARWPAVGLTREGAHAYFLDFVEGEAIGRRVLRNPELAAARQNLPAQLAGALAAIHAVPLASLGVLERTRNARDPVALALGTLRHWMDQLQEPHPACELALRWLHDRAPRATRVTLVHGDFRMGNFMVTPAGLSAVLDWEFARTGDPVEDLGWLCVRDWRFGNTAQHAGGLCTRQALLDAYAQASGVTVEMSHLVWWEVFGNVRWALGSVFQCERHLSGAQKSLELVAIGRRAVEMEFEALRLMQQGA